MGCITYRYLPLNYFIDPLCCIWHLWSHALCFSCCSECPKSSLIADIFVFLIFPLSTLQCLMLLRPPSPPWTISLTLMALHIPSSKLQTSAISCLLESQNQRVTTAKFIILAKLSSPRYSPSQLMSLTFTHLCTLEIWRHLWLFPHIELIIKACPFLLLKLFWNLLASLLPSVMCW